MAEWSAQQEARERREDLFSHIAQADHVGVTELVRRITIIPDLGTPLAIRCDGAKFGVRQVLYGIVRAGSHGFGLATAYGTDISKPGCSYITHINADPYERETRMVSPLLPEVQVRLGGESKLVPDLLTEDQDFVVSADQKGEIRVRAERLGQLPFQLISAVHPLSQREGTGQMPLDEVGTWALPPAYVKRVLRLH